MKQLFFVLLFVLIPTFLWSEQTSLLLEPMEFEFLIPVEYHDPYISPLKSEVQMSQVLERENLQKEGKETIIDGLKGLSGVREMQQYRKYRRQILLRGETPLVLLDGNLVGDDQRILYTLPVEMIEKIEMIRSSSALAYGSAQGQNLVGIINIVTRRPEKKRRTLTLEFGNFQTMMAGYGFSEQKGRNGLSIFYRRKITAGPENQNAASDMGSFSLIYQRKTLRGDRFSLRFFREEGMMEIPHDLFVAGGNNRFVTAEEWLYDPWKTTMLNLEYDRQWNSRQSTRCSIWLNRRDATNRWVAPGAVTPTSSIRDSLSGMTIRHLMVSPLAHTHTQFGIVSSHLNNPTGKFYYVYQGGKEYRSLGWFFQVEKEYPSGWTVDGGIRQDRTRMLRDSTFPANKPGLIEDVDQPALTAMSIGVHRKLSNKVKFSLRLNQSERAPVERNAVRSGIPLENEKQLSMDVGLEMTLNPRHQLRCSLFNYRRDNALVDDGYFVINGVDTRAYLNADLRQAGLELQHDWQISNNWSLQSNYSRMNRNSEQTATNLGFISGVSDQPKYFWNSALHWQGRRFSTIINHHYMSGYQNSELLPGNKTVLYAMGDFHTTDVTVNYRLPNKKNRQEYLQVHIQNLEDKHYHTMNGHHNPDFGRRILFSYRLNY